MRALCVLALSTAAVHAQPAANNGPLIIEPVPARPPLPALGTKGTGAPGVNDVWASGIVMAPPAHADAAPWPRGMVMTPEESHDANVLELGSNALPPGARVAPPGWAARLSRGLAAGVGGALGLLVPPTL